MLKILQVRLQQNVNCELLYVQAGFRKGRGTRDQIVNILWIMEKARGFQENIYFSLTDYTSLTLLKSLCGSQQTVENLQEMGIPNYLTSPLRNLPSEISS